MGRVLHGAWLLAVFAAWATLVAFWWRSGREMDEWSAVDADNTLRAAVSFKGRLHLVRAQNNAAPRPLGWDAQRVPATATWRDLHLGRSVDWERAGFARLSYVAPPPVGPAPVMIGATMPGGGGGGPGPQRVLVARPAAAGPPPVMSAVSPWLLTWPYDAWMIPYWAPVVILSLPLGKALLGFVKRWWRRRQGLCAGCGYDLRESPDVCPECGDKAPRGRRPRRDTRAGTAPAAGTPA
jgi:hypothetical protein